MGWAGFAMTRAQPPLHHHHRRCRHIHGTVNCQLWDTYSSDRSVSRAAASRDFNCAQRYSSQLVLLKDADNSIQPASCQEGGATNAAAAACQLWDTCANYGTLGYFSP